MNCWQNLFHLLADVREFFVNWAAIVVETRCLEDDPSGANHHCHCENPQEQSVENHCHVFPVLFGLGENKYEGWPGIRSIFLATDGGISKFGSNAKANQFLFFNQIPNLFLIGKVFFLIFMDYVSKKPDKYCWIINLFHSATQLKGFSPNYFLNPVVNRMSL